MLYSNANPTAETNARHLFTTVIRASVTTARPLEREVFWDRKRTRVKEANVFITFYKNKWENLLLSRGNFPPLIPSTQRKIHCTQCLPYNFAHRVKGKSQHIVIQADLNDQFQGPKPL
ncbi:hypothetical protein CDAR_543131 [Caerostris darwini]|uniref:Uncharacterized protein n=1 Tax=Caerostris darwini TaxID=1538125 RepID=A0AAV4X6B3_9ARAC|nr:hypothetical protein CDAR_543131 [Caerostris darwini]